MQQMKLYTEEQLVNTIDAIRDYLKNYPEKFHESMIEKHLKNLEPIELPSDEEIDRESEVLYPINKGGSMWMPSRYDIDKKNRQEGFLDGAKWMRNKMGGKNEQQ
jgi:hypothetical protein